MVPLNKIVVTGASFSGCSDSVVFRRMHEYAENLKTKLNCEYAFVVPLIDDEPLSVQLFQGENNNIIKAVIRIYTGNKSESKSKVYIDEIQKYLDDNGMENIIVIRKTHKTENHPIYIVDKV